MKYYHISVATPFGFSEIIHRDELHPLDPDMMKRRRNQIATQLAIKTKQLVPTEAINFISFNEIPLNVAAKMWPEDFKV
jgi:hypothetical protein